jgi:hypothetical protein
MKKKLSLFFLIFAVIGNIEASFISPVEKDGMALIPLPNNTGGCFTINKVASRNDIYIAGATNLQEMLDEGALGNLITSIATFLNLINLLYLKKTSNSILLHMLLIPHKIAPLFLI